MDTKLSKVRALVAQGRDLEALRIVAKFPRLGNEKETITRGWNAFNNPDFYRQLGRDPEQDTADAIHAMKAKYDLLPAKEEA